MLSPQSMIVIVLLLLSSVFADECNMLVDQESCCNKKECVFSGETCSETKYSKCLIATKPELEVLNDLVFDREFPRGSIAFGMQKSSKEQLKHALETGYTFFDGADSYKHEGTDTTVLLARVMVDNNIAREKVHVVYKVDPAIIADVKDKIDALAKKFPSSNKCGCHYIDYVMVHHSGDVPRANEITTALAPLVASGVIRSFGYGDINDNAESKALIDAGTSFEVSAMWAVAHSDIREGRSCMYLQELAGTAITFVYSLRKAVKILFRVDDLDEKMKTKLGIKVGGTFTAEHVESQVDCVSQELAASGYNYGIIIHASTNSQRVENNFKHILGQVKNDNDLCELPYNWRSVWNAARDRYTAPQDAFPKEIFDKVGSAFHTTNQDFDGMNKLDGMWNDPTEESTRIRKEKKVAMIASLKGSDVDMLKMWSTGEPLTEPFFTEKLENFRLMDKMDDMFSVSHCSRAAAMRLFQCQLFSNVQVTNEAKGDEGEVATGEKGDLERFQSDRSLLRSQ